MPAWSGPLPTSLSSFHTTFLLLCSFGYLSIPRTHEALSYCWIFAFVILSTGNYWFLFFVHAAAKSFQSCPTLCDPIDGSPPGSPVPGILQARTLEWVAISFSNAWKWKVKGSRSVVSNSEWPQGLQPTRLLHPWDFPGKSTGVGCHCLLHFCSYLCSNFTFRSLHLYWILYPKSVFLFFFFFLFLSLIFDLSAQLAGS